MLRRWLLASAFCVCGMFAILAVEAYETYWKAPAGQSFVATPVFSLSNLLVAMLLGIFAVWFSGRLIR